MMAESTNTKRHFLRFYLNGENKLFVLLTAAKLIPWNLISDARFEPAWTSPRDRKRGWGVQKWWKHVDILSPAR